MRMTRVTSYPFSGEHKRSYRSGLQAPEMRSGRQSQQKGRVAPGPVEPSCA